MKREKRLLAVTVGVSLLTLSGCMSTGEVANPVETITNPQYLVNIPDAEIMPSKEALRSPKLRIVVLPTRIDSSADFDKGADRELTSKLENGLFGTNVEVIDRSLAGRLGDEIVAYEASGQFSGSGINLADIAILPAVQNVQISSGYTPSSTYTNDGKTYTNPAGCNHTSKFSGNVKVYRLPELTLVEGIALEGSYTNSFASGDRNCNISKSLGSSLAANAAEKAIDNSLFEIQKHLTASGYVIEYRKREDDHLVQINLGSNSGVKAGQKIQFVHKVKSTNRLSGKTRIMEIPYEQIGVVSNLVEQDSAWVIVDEALETKLKFGDVARQLFQEKTMWEKMVENVN